MNNPGATGQRRHLVAKQPCNQFHRKQSPCDKVYGESSERSNCRLEQENSAGQTLASSDTQKNACTSKPSRRAAKHTHLRASASIVCLLKKNIRSPERTCCERVRHQQRRARLMLCQRRTSNNVLFMDASSFVRARQLTLSLRPLVSPPPLRPSSSSAARPPAPTTACRLESCQLVRLD